MDIRKLQRAIVDGLEDVKAQNIVVFNTEHLSALFERVIIASGTSNRQTKSLASSVREAVKTAGFSVPRTEGESNGEWIIVDCGAAVVHVMQPTIRDYYHLEEIWGGKPVNMKLDSGVTKLVKAAEPDKPGKARKPAAKKAVAAPAAKKTAAKSPAAKSPAAKTAAKKAVTATRAAPRKPTAPAPRATVTRVVGVKKAPAKPSASKRAPAAKKAPVARKAVAKKAPGRKTTSRK
ncbi:MAG: ribosome silencing factor [Burkholderiales bacterium]|nr:ribosome silencing factor [Burkholderiales bacterium]